MPTGHLEATFFDSPAAFGAWLRAHHATRTELWVGFHRKATGRPSLTWPESVAEALCYGWIDGVRKRVDETRYAIRFTPRKATSNWSAVNVKMIGELIAAGRVQPAGMAAWERRLDAKTGIYAYEQRDQATLAPADERAFRRNKAAWTYWQSRSASYHKLMTWWIVSAKKEETRAKRLARLIEACEAGKQL